MTAAEGARGEAPARAALAGNPSDGYGGAVLALALPGFAARACARPALALTVSPESELVAATVRRFARSFGPRRAEQVTAVQWSTTVPRGVGLGGSSAVVIAAARALSALYRIAVGADELAEFALAVETEELGIAAGLQDRVAQSYGGLTFMEFSASRSYERLDPGLLPPLLVAWRPEAGGDSGPVHSDLRERFHRGEPPVRAAVSELADAARGARAALLSRDAGGFARCVDATFDARRRMMSLDPRHVEMVEAVRSCGASANYTGSGGAIIAVCRDLARRRAVRAALDALDCASRPWDRDRQ